MKNWKIRELKDFTIRTIDNDEMAGFEFEVYEVVGWQEGGKKLYERKGAVQSGDFAEHGFDDAQPYLTGFVKWDGCSHFYFGEEQGYLHLCGLDRIERLRTILDMLIQYAKMTGVEGESTPPASTVVEMKGKTI